MDKETLIQKEIYHLEALHECLLKERDLLILFQTEEILQNNARKECLAQELKQVTASRRFIIGDGEFSSTPEGKIFSEKHASLKELCLSNQCFIERSLHRQSQFLENLRKLMAGPPLYSQNGSCHSNSQEGRVIASLF